MNSIKIWIFTILILVNYQIKSNSISQMFGWAVTPLAYIMDRLDAVLPLNVFSQLTKI